MASSSLIFDWTIAASLRASIVVLVVLVVQRLLYSRLSPKWKYTLWLPVLVTILVPAQPLLPPWARLTADAWHAAPGVESASEGASVNLGRADDDVNQELRSQDTVPGAVKSVGDIDANETYVETTFTSDYEVRARTESEDNFLLKPDDQLHLSTVAMEQRWHAILTGAWLLGAVCLSVVVTISYMLTLREIRRCAIPAGQSNLAGIESLVKELGLRQTPKVWLSSAVKTPAVCGIFRPVLLLNGDFFCLFTREECESVLRHELMHIRRGDLLLNAILCMLLALHWFNPLLWFAFFRVRADREAACDEDVLRDVAIAQRVAYGKTLLKMASAFPEPGWSLGFVGMMQKENGLQERIRFITNPKSMGIWMKSVVLVCMLFATILGVAKATQPHPDAASALPEASEGTDLQPWQTDLSEFFDFLQEVAKDGKTPDREYLVDGILRGNDSRVVPTTHLFARNGELNEFDGFVDLKPKQGTVQWCVNESLKGRTISWEFEVAKTRPIKVRKNGARREVAGILELVPRYHDEGNQFGRNLPISRLSTIRIDAPSDQPAHWEITAGDRVRVEGTIGDYATNKGVRLTNYAGPIVLYKRKSDHGLLQTTVSIGLRDAKVTAAKRVENRGNAIGERTSDPGGEAEPAIAAAPFDADRAKAHQDAWAKHLGRPVDLTNSVGMKLTLIPPGTVTMGTDADPGVYDDPHDVAMNKSFYIGVYEVTQEQFDVVTGKYPSRFPGDANPVEMVSWNDAVEFCRQLSEMPKEKEAGRVYRLPTKYEWEYACRAGMNSNFSFGDGESQLEDYGWYKGNSGNRTHPVGEKKPNQWGLHDTHGNVWEWCSDTYSLRVGSRVYRGGGFGSGAPGCVSWYYDGHRPNVRSSNTGFRVVLDQRDIAPGSRKRTFEIGNQQNELTVIPSNVKSDRTANEIQKAAMAWVDELDAKIIRDETKDDHPVIEVKIGPNSRGRVTDADLKHLEAFPELKKLDLSFSKITDVGLRKVGLLSNLEVLRISCCWSGGISGEGIRALSSLDELKELDLYWTSIGDEGAKELAALTSLRDLELSATKITDDAIKTVSVLPNLVTLGLAGNEQVGDLGIKYLASLKRLESLNLSNLSISDEGLKSVCTHNKSLKGLSLGGTPVTDKGAAHLVELENLQGLSLGNKLITDKALRHVARIKGLRWLNLDGSTRIAGRGLKQLAELKELRSLSLEGSQIGDAGVLYLRDLRLEYLNLYESQITDQGLIELSKSQTLRKSLKTMHVGRTYVTNHGVEVFLKAIPCDLTTVWRG